MIAAENIVRRICEKRVGKRNFIKQCSEGTMEKIYEFFIALALLNGES